MTSSFSIVVASAPEAKGLFEQVTPALQAEGHKVISCYGSDFHCVSREALAEAQILLSYGLPVGASEYDAAPNLIAVISPTLGYEWIDVDAATERGIAIANGLVPENYESMAEAGIMLMLASLYDLHAREAALRSNTRPAPGRMLKGRTIGLIGYGNIARSIVDRLEGWGASFLVHRRRDDQDPRVTNVELDTLLRESDIVLVAASLNAGSRHLIGADQLASMKRDAILVNLARGGLIDENALAAHVADGGLAHVALDVFETEPLPDGSPLRELDNMILTPHSIGHTQESFAGIPRILDLNTRAIMSGKLPASLCNPEVSEVWIARS